MTETRWIRGSYRTCCCCDKPKLVPVEVESYPRGVVIHHFEFGPESERE